MKHILSLALLCSALSVNHAHAFIEALDFELGEGVNSWNELNVSVSLHDPKSKCTASHDIKRVYSLEGARLHASPGYNQDETTTPTLDCGSAAYTAHAQLHILEENAVVLDYDVYQQSIFKYELEQWPLNYIIGAIRFPTSGTTNIKSSFLHHLALNTEFQDVIKPEGTDIELILKIKAVLRKEKFLPSRKQLMVMTIIDVDDNNDDDDADKV